MVERLTTSADFPSEYKAQSPYVAKEQVRFRDQLTEIAKHTTDNASWSIGTAIHLLGRGFWHSARGVIGRPAPKHSS